jgi:hypothetical protein
MNTAIQNVPLYRITPEWRGSGAIFPDTRPDDTALISAIEKELDK